MAAESIICSRPTCGKPSTLPCTHCRIRFCSKECGMICAAQHGHASICRNRPDYYFSNFRIVSCDEKNVRCGLATAFTPVIKNGVHRWTGITNHEIFATSWNDGKPADPKEDITNQVAFSARWLTKARANVYPKEQNLCEIGRPIGTVISCAREMAVVLMEPGFVLDVKPNMVEPVATKPLGTMKLANGDVAPVSLDVSPGPFFPVL